MILGVFYFALLVSATTLAATVFITRTAQIVTTSSTLKILPSSAMPIFESSSSQKLTTPYNLTSGFNATVMLRLNLNETFNTNYTVKTSSDYIELAKNVRESLIVAYRELPGFHDVIIEDLACKREVVAKHVVLSREKNNANVIEAYLILSNLTNGFLKGKVVDVNKVCLASTSSTRVVDENNYVYMIVFVCVTALLLLAMVSVIFFKIF